MMNRLRTRSDYHIFNSHSAGLQTLSLNSWLKPLFWLVVGGILGMSYNKKAVDSCYDLLAFTESEKRTVVATAPHPSTHATARGNASSKV